MRFLAVLVAACLFVAIAAAAQQSPCTQRTIPVSAVTQAGQLVTGLTAANFTAKFDGKPVTVSSVTLPKSPPTVLILLDTSGSMETFPRQLNGEIDLVESFISRLPLSVPIGLTTVGDKAISRIAPTTNRPAFRRELEDLRAAGKIIGPKGKTPLWDAILSIITPAGKLDSGDVIYAITDGADSTSHAEVRKAQDALLAARVRVFGALWREAPGVGMEFRPNIIQASGGDAFDVPGPDAYAPGSLADLNLPTLAMHSQQFLLAREPFLLSLQAQEIVNYYDVALSLPAQVRKRSRLQLTLAGMEKSAASHPILRYPQQLMPCDSAGSTRTR
jgi:Mg-chelatase subunit ChlD